MPSIGTLFGILVLGAGVMYAFAFTLIGLAGEALIVLAVLGLLIRGVQYVVGRIEILRPRR